MTLARFFLLALLFLAACAQPKPLALNRTVTPAPTAGPAPPITIPSLPPAPTSIPVPMSTPVDELAQYRVWMEQARQVHPYVEPVDQMWAVMMCESTGNPTLIADPYHGLFQYLPSTWSGEWNPYRDQPILDPQAQIFATAKAWQDGNQGWWGCF